MEDNSKIISTNGKKYNFLFDTSTILYFQTMHAHSGASIFKAIEDCHEVNFFVINDVLSELMKGPNGLNPTQIGSFFDHILNAESSGDRDRKENRFLKTINGKIYYVVLNKVSATDYAQVLLCQNHEELMLVANDKKLIKSAAQIIEGRRVFGIPGFLDYLLEICPDNEKIKVLKKTGEELFEKKHAFGNISEEQFNKKYKKA